MKKIIKSKIEFIYQKAITQLSCLLFFLKALFYSKKLSLNSFIYSNFIITNTFELNWNVEGCYKIIIKDIGSFPGNSAGLKLLLKSNCNKLDVTFYGIKSSIKKVVEINKVDIDLVDKFVPQTKLPELKTSSFSKHKIKNTLSEQKLVTNSLTIIRNLNIESKLKLLKVLPRNIIVKLEPFNINNYLTKNSK